MKCVPSRAAFWAAAILSIGAYAQPSLGAITTILDRDDPSVFMTSYPNSQTAFNTFTGSLPYYGVATIDDVPAAPNPLNPTITFTGSSITATTQNVLVQGAPGFQIGTQALLEYDGVGGPQGDTVFTFNQQINAFGLYLIQSGDGANNSNLIRFRLQNTVTNSSVDVPIQAGPNWGTDNVLFFGVTDTTSFNQVTIVESNDLGDGTLYDNIVAGKLAVPEPSTLAMAALVGLGTVGGTRRLRRA